MVFALPKKGKRPTKRTVCFCLAAALLGIAAGFLLFRAAPGSFAGAAAPDRYEVRSRLLTQAMERVGVCTPEEAARLWGDGLRERSAALQYAALGQPLRAEYARRLETNAPNWVTGMSSPWVDGFTVSEEKAPDADSRAFRLTFSTVTSTGPAGTYRAELTVRREGSFWRISRLSMDPELYPYTGFTPPV